ncbi:Vacuolar fusion protein mon1b [Entomortierella beljakovae]|nr:Vacuolar fusion protein mon1b [Entomortierella beljakovae]
MSSQNSNISNGVNDSTPNKLSPPNLSSVQNATSPRLIPSKTQPTTSLIFNQPPQQQQQDTESLSGDELALSTSPSTTKNIVHPKKRAISKMQPSTDSTAATAESSREEMRSRRLSGLNQNVNSDSSDEADDRLTDTESEQDRTGTPVIAGHAQIASTMDHGNITALQSLRDIEEHDKGDRRHHGFKTTEHITDRDSDNERSDTPETAEVALDPGQIQDKLKLLRPKLSNSNTIAKSQPQKAASVQSFDSDDISDNFGGYQKRYGTEDHTSSSWTTHRKHFFILSSAGKPIYARYGDESRISSYMGVIQALISFFADNDDSIRCMNAGQHKFVFLLKSPLYLVCVSRSGESESLLRDQLGYLYSQIISVLTHSQMTRIFEQRNNFDLRGLIGGTEIFLDSLGKLMNTYPGFMLGAIQCLTMPRELRDKVGSVLGRAKCKSLLYAILLTPTQLITLLRPRTESMHPSDLHLIFNLLSGSTTFESSESWTPICLPKFNNKSFLHAYICYIAKKVCMLLISPDKDSFFEMSNVKQKVVEGLEAGGMLTSLENYAAAGPRGGFSIGDTGIPGLRHFLYKSRTHVQFTMPELAEPYTTLSAQKRLLCQYQHMHERMHRKTRPLKLLFHVGEHETMLGWITSSFELYAAFGPFVSKSAVVLMSNKLLRWIRKQEDSLLILNSPSFEKFK